MVRMVIWILLGVFSAPATGGPSASPEQFRLAGIEPIVTPAQYRELLLDLDMGPGELEAGELLLRDYGDAMQQVLSDLESRQTADRELLDSVLRGESRISADELRRLRISLRTAARSACETADEHVVEMVEWATLLSMAEPQVKRDAVGRFNRRVYLAGKGRDALIDIAQLAMASDEVGQVEDSEIERSLQGYTSSLATRARIDALTARSRQFDDGIAAITKDSDKRRKLQGEGSTRWRERMSLHDQAVEAVAGLLDASQVPSWRAAAAAALFPSIYRQPDALRAARWVQENAAESVAAHAEACLAASRTRLGQLRQEAVSLVRQGREVGVDLEHDASALVESAAEIRMKFLRNSGERSVLEQEMLDCVMRPLTDGQRAAVRYVLRTTS
jgi:hypothetical protein